MTHWSIMAAIMRRRSFSAPMRKSPSPWRTAMRAPRADRWRAAVHNVVGLQHASMAIYNAWADRLPVIVLGGTGPMDTANRRPWIDWVHTALVQGNLVRDFVKWDDQPASVEAVPDSFIRAYRLATTEPQGPVYICYDGDVQEKQLERRSEFPVAGSLSRAAAVTSAGRRIRKDDSMAARGKEAGDYRRLGRQERSRIQSAR